MEKFECKMCDFSTRVKCNLNRHLSTEKHKKKEKVIQSQPKPIVLVTKKNEFLCKHCEREFTCKQSMHRHVKYRCPKNKETEVQKMIRTMMEEQQKNHEKQIQQIISQFKPTQINTTNNNTTNNTTNNTVIQNNYILPYKDTDTSHLTTKDYAFCVKQPDGVKRLIEKIHFNPMKPENQNLTITNLTDKYMMVYDGTQWKKVLKSELNKIYNHKESLLEEWVEQDPALKEKFYEFIKTERKDVHLERIEAIKLMMYNQKPVAIL